ncbi:NAD(P)-binding protein [Backusella circina FSU 941]|nr:NAD(P)-binding protein [Backusella circina FSU 941]
MSDKIFILGATGDIGSKLVNFLLKKNADITVYVRDVEKTKKLYPDVKNLRIVQGDYKTTDVFEREIAGHNRLFLLVSADPNFSATKGLLAKIAYGAGVRQIVDISSFTVNLPYRSGFISSIHRHGEEKILAEKGDDQYLVALRPGRFLTTIFGQVGKKVKENSTYEVVDDLDYKYGYISTVDIAEFASVVLTEPVEKHVNSVYTLIGDSLSANEVSAVLSDLLGREIKGKRVSYQEKYDEFISFGFPHFFAYDLISLKGAEDNTPFGVILGRPPQTVRQWLQEVYNLADLQ